jgi:carbon-monoxide dehydrogenase small subunit
MSPTQGKATDEEQIIRVTVNGVRRSGIAEPRMLLHDFIRHELEMTGTHAGCEHGVCGACTIKLDGEVVRSCIMLAVQADGAEIETIEGMATEGDLHPIQEAFRQEHGLQCGFCTPGMVMATQGLLESNPNPTEEEIRDYLSGNICRCTGYVGIVAAVKNAAEKLSVVQVNGNGKA